MGDNTTRQQQERRGTLRSYVFGFVFSVVLTVGAYLLVVNDTLSGWVLVAAIAGLAVVQLVVQLIFFLHLNNGPGGRWNLAMFLFMLMVVFILVGGSLWIMNNLHYNMTGPEMDEYMRHQSEKGF